MIRSGLVCLLLGVLAWGQAPKPPQDAPAQTAPTANPAVQAKPAPVALDAAVITINGLCDHPPTDKSVASGCKLVFTRAQFENFADLVQPNLPPAQRRQLAASYADMLILAEQAQEMGLDKGPRFEELLKLQRLSLLGGLLKQALQEKAAQISDKDIADYYQQNITVYEEAQLQRVYVPHIQQLDPPKEQLTASELRNRQQDSEMVMKKEADQLQARALAGEDLGKLQDEAYKVAGIKTAFPASKMQTYRRSDLSPAQVSVMNLKSGEVSPVIKDANGYFIYKAGEKDTVPLVKVRDGIVSTLRAQRLQQYMKAAQQSATTDLNDEYFTLTPGGGEQGISVPHKVASKDREPSSAQ